MGARGLQHPRCAPNVLLAKLENARGDRLGSLVSRFGGKRDGAVAFNNEKEVAMRLTDRVAVGLGNGQVEDVGHPGFNDGGNGDLFAGKPGGEGNAKEVRLDKDGNVGARGPIPGGIVGIGRADRREQDIAGVGGDLEHD